MWLLSEQNGLIAYQVWKYCWLYKVYGVIWQWRRLWVGRIISSDMLWHHSQQIQLNKKYSYMYVKMYHLCFPTIVPAIFIYFFFHWNIDNFLTERKTNTLKWNVSQNKSEAWFNPLRTVLIYGCWVVCRYFCRAANWVDRRVKPNCWWIEILQLCVYMSAILHMYAIFMHSAYSTCTRMHYAAIHVTCVLVGMRLYSSTGPVASLKLLL